MNTIYTVGYQATTPDALLATVDELGALLVDIRYSPWSPAPQWRKTALAELVGTDRYLWLQDLGNVLYKQGGIKLLAPEAAAERLRPILASQPILLLCACRNVDYCHRLPAAAYLSEALGATIEHLAGTKPEPTARRKVSA